MTGNGKRAVGRSAPPFGVALMLTLGATGCAESVYEVSSPLPVLLGPVERIGAAPRPASDAKNPTIDATLSRTGGSLGTSIDTISVDLAIMKAQINSHLPPADADVRVSWLSGRAYIFYSIPYLPYPALQGGTSMHFEGTIESASGGVR